MKALQEEQLRHHIQPDGYWMAEADPMAARHPLTHRAPLTELPWCVLATDSAYEPIELHEMNDREHIVNLDATGLNDLLVRRQELEERNHDGQAIHRAKRHDDKSLAVARL